MKNPLLEKPLVVNIVILVVSFIISSFALLFGFAYFFEGVKQIIEGSGPDHHILVSIQGWIVVLFLCTLGISTLILGIAAVGAILHRFFP